MTASVITDKVELVTSKWIESIPGSKISTSKFTDRATAETVIEEVILDQLRHKQDFTYIDGQVQYVHHRVTIMYEICSI